MSRYWLFSGDAGMDYTILKKRMREVGLAPYPDYKLVKDGHLLYSHERCGITHVDFLHTELITDVGAMVRSDPNTYKIHTRIHNMLDAKTIDPLRRKDLLHHALAGSKFIAKTYILEDFKYDGGVWILRPSNIFTHSGIDIIIASNAEEFDLARKFYSEKAQAHQKFHKLHAKYYTVIVSEYIIAPLLIHERKFHLRLYMLCIPDHKPSIARKHGKILTAKDPYKQADWSNTDIHDTHVKSSLADFMFPRDFPAQEMLPAVNTQLDELEAALAPLCAGQTPYIEQADKGYHIFGLDVMLHSDGRIILIEINERPGYDFKNKNSPDREDLCNKHCEWLWEHINVLFHPI